jgi:Fur family transcriptional regulator, ferric uptake regulator
MRMPGGVRDTLFDTTTQYEAGRPIHARQQKIQLLRFHFRSEKQTSVARSELTKAGLKVTTPRLRVLEILEQAEPHHLSAEDVYRHLIGGEDSVGLATVYRVLTQFVDAGIVERHNFDDGRAVYEVSKHDHHDHMVDIDTGRVTEFVSDRIETLQREIAAEQGYELVDHELVLYVRKRKS